MKRLIGLILGLIGLVLPFLVEPNGLELQGRVALGIFLMAGIFWISEAIPIHATSMLVIFLQVLLLSNMGLLFGNEASSGSTDYAALPYNDFYATLASPIIILFLGGFSLAAAAVQYDLDKNLTRFLLKPFGRKPAYVCLGLMSVTAVLSAFMSNTATTAMMMALVLPIVARVEIDDPFRKTVALAIPVGANIGGIATPIGTPPNAVVLAALREQGVVIEFSTWMAMTLPLVAVMLFFAWRLLLYCFPPRLERFTLEMNTQFPKTWRAWVTYGIFVLTISLWITEKLHGIPSTLVAFLPVALLPAFDVLRKESIRSFPWEVLWLMAGGIALGVSVKHTGLDAWMVQQVDWSTLSGWGLVSLFGLMGYALANLVSHTVAATLLLPIAISVGTAVLPEASWIVATIIIGVIVSFSMVLPISTPPNAIAMGTGLINTRDLMKVGLVIGLVGCCGALLSGFLFWTLFF